MNNLLKSMVLATTLTINPAGAMVGDPETVNMNQIMGITHLLTNYLVHGQNAAYADTLDKLLSTNVAPHLTLITSWVSQNVAAAWLVRDNERVEAQRHAKKVFAYGIVVGAVTAVVITQTIAGYFYYSASQPVECTVTNDTLSDCIRIILNSTEGE